MRRLARQILFIALAIASGACASVRESDFATYRVRSERAATAHGLPLADGQIVVSESGGALSFLFRLFDPEYSPYVHAGIVARERDRFHVYHAVGRLKATFGGPPTDSIHGGVRREPLLHYLARQRVAAIYDLPPGVDPVRVVAFVRDAHARGVPFDAYFDTSERERLYCAELVAAALEHAGAPPVPRRWRRANRSLDVLLDWLKIRDRRFIATRDLIAPEREVALVSRRLTPRAIALHRAARAELHRRFSADQRLGHVFVWRAGRLGFRDEVVAFERAARALRPAPTGTDAGAVPRAVAALAERMLGAFPPQPHRAEAAP